MYTYMHIYIKESGADGCEICRARACINANRFEAKTDFADRLSGAVSRARAHNMRPS